MFVHLQSTRGTPHDALCTDFVRRGAADTAREHRGVPYDNTRQILPNTKGGRYVDRTQKGRASVQVERQC